MIVRAADEENERFYGEHGISPSQILSGQVGTPFDASNSLYSTWNAVVPQSIHMSGSSGSGKCPGGLSGQGASDNGSVIEGEAPRHS